MGARRSTKKKRHEPMPIKYGKRRVFHMPHGHDTCSQKMVGFVAALQRGAECAATGRVSVPIPADFPSADKASSRPGR